MFYLAGEERNLEQTMMEVVVAFNLGWWSFRSFQLSRKIFIVVHQLRLRLISYDRIINWEKLHVYGFGSFHSSLQELSFLLSNKNKDSTVDSSVICNLPRNAREQVELLQNSLESQLSLARAGFAAYANAFISYKVNSFCVLYLNPQKSSRCISL